MLGPSASLFLVFLQLLNAFVGFSYARPTLARTAGGLVIRQNNGTLTEPITVQTQDVLQTCVPIL